MAAREEPLYMPEGEARLWEAVLTLAQELSVARDQIDLLQRRLAVKGLLHAGEAEDQALDAEALAARAAERSAFVARLLKPRGETP